jgi:hypothetical protein
MNRKACAVCARELVFYTLGMQARPAPSGLVYCAEHDPRTGATIPSGTATSSRRTG